MPVPKVDRYASTKRISLFGFELSENGEAQLLRGEIADRHLPAARANSFLSARILESYRVADTEVTVCSTCPHSEFKPVCTLATSCLTEVPTDPGCGEIS